VSLSADPQDAAGHAGRAEPPDGALARAVTGQCAELLRDTYLPRLRRALAELPAGDLWWRPHERSTSAGNLLLHLEGNIRQWIVSGLGGAPDARERDAEFAPRHDAPGPAGSAVPAAEPLLAALEQTVHAACAILARLDAAALLGPVTIQGFRTNRLGAVLHVTEHMSWHTGQLAWIAKLRAGAHHGLAYYDDAALASRRGRSGAPAPSDELAPSNALAPSDALAPPDARTPPDARIQP
jgi:uncharacterized damage-inducible protein DinB